MKRLVSAFLAGAMALSLAACGGAASTSTVASSASASGSAAASETAASDLDYIKEKGKMVIGYTVYEPMNYTDADGNLPVLIPSWQLPCAKSWESSRSSWRSTGIPRWWSWMPRASTASGTV